LLAVGVLSLPDAVYDMDAIRKRMIHVNGACDEKAEIASFMKYWGIYMSPVPRWHAKDAQSHIPWPWFHAAILMERFGYTKDQAWSELCCEAFWMFASSSVLYGATNVLTLRQQELKVMMKENG